jgi:hypothetical protein
MPRIVVLHGRTLIGSAVRPHCVGKRSTEISQCSWARGPGAFLSPHWSYVATAQPAFPAAPPHQQQRFGQADSSTPANVFLGAASRDHTAEVERELERVLTLGARGGVIFLGMMPFFSWRRCASAVYWCSCAHCEQSFIVSSKTRLQVWSTIRWSRTESSPASQRAFRFSELNRQHRIDGEQSINLVKEQTMIIRAGFDIAFELSQPTPMILLLSVHPSRAEDVLTDPRLVASPGMPMHNHRDTFGNQCTRVMAPAGPVGFSSSLDAETPDFLTKSAAMPDVIL